MTHSQQEQQRLAEIDAIAHLLPDHIVDKARNDTSITAQQLAYAQKKGAAEAIQSLDSAIDKINKERLGHNQI